MSASQTPLGNSLFATTRWSVVLTARDGAEPAAAAAMETLCATYWGALYAYARRQGLPPPDAEDATQGFFARLLEKDYLQAVEMGRGPFRAFLQMAFKRFLAKERARVGALRRGGGALHLDFDFVQAESACTSDPLGLAADELFETRWALTALASAIGVLKQEYGAAGKAREFEVMKTVLSAAPESLSYAELGAALQISPGACRVAAHRLRKRLRELFRAEVAQTVACREDVDEEVRRLVSALARS